MTIFAIRRLDFQNDMRSMISDVIKTGIMFAHSESLTFADCLFDER